MGVSDTITVAPGVTRFDSHWGYLLEGSKEAMVASGLVLASWFCDGRERDKRGRIHRTNCLVVDGRDVETTAPARGPCQVRFIFSQQEYEARTFREELRDAKAREAKRLGELPRTHEQFRNEAAESMERYLSNARYLLDPGHAGYRFAPEVLDAFDIAASNILQAVAEGRSVFNPKTRGEYVAYIKAKTASDTAQLDPGLRRFIDGLDLKG